MFNLKDRLGRGKLSYLGDLKITSLAELPATWKWRSKRANITMAQLADIVDVSPSTFSQIVTGKRDAKLILVDKVERELRKMEE